MPISPVSSLPGDAPLGRQPTKELGKDDFLKLLAGQLRHQDPSNAGGGEEFMAQMTQFAMLEQITKMAAGQQQATSASASSQAVGLIGKQVTYQDASGVVREAAVEKVLYVDGAPKLVLAGVEDALALTDVQEVR